LLCSDLAPNKKEEYVIPILHLFKNVFVLK
jgi:hypothetical protein